MAGTTTYRALRKRKVPEHVTRARTTCPRNVRPFCRGAVDRPHLSHRRGTGPRLCVDRKVRSGPPTKARNNILAAVLVRAKELGDDQGRYSPRWTTTHLRWTSAATGKHGCIRHTKQLVWTSEPASTSHELRGHPCIGRRLQPSARRTAVGLRASSVSGLEVGSRPPWSMPLARVARVEAKSRFSRLGPFLALEEPHVAV